MKPAVLPLTASNVACGYLLAHRKRTQRLGVSVLEHEEYERAQDDGGHGQDQNELGGQPEQPEPTVPRHVEDDAVAYGPQEDHHCGYPHDYFIRPESREAALFGQEHEPCVIERGYGLEQRHHQGLLRRIEGPEVDCQGDESY